MSTTKIDRCAGCDQSVRTIEKELEGTYCDLARSVVEIMDGEEWSADTLDAIAHAAEALGFAPFLEPSAQEPKEE